MMRIQEYGKSVYWLGKQLKSLCRVLSITAKHFYASFTHNHRPMSVTQSAYFQEQIGALSLQYPHEKLPVPERGRYKLDNLIEDCIMCDRCVRVCPVDCIQIEAIPSPTVIGKTSNGMPKRLYAAKFDIDMAKCCFCGLCTTVCPTACLTMTSEYDFSAVDFAEHKQSFATMSPQEVKEKKSAWTAYAARQEK